MRHGGCVKGDCVRVLGVVVQRYQSVAVEVVLKRACSARSSMMWGPRVVMARWTSARRCSVWPMGVKVVVMRVPGDQRDRERQSDRE